MFPSKENILLWGHHELCNNPSYGSTPQMNQPNYPSFALNNKRSEDLNTWQPPSPSINEAAFIYRWYEYPCVSVYACVNAGALWNG